jgi:hypothetical protein
MPIKFEPRFTRQAIPKTKRGGLVVPANAQFLPSLSTTVASIVGSMPPPTSRPNSFHFHYINYPFSKHIFEDGQKLNNGIYEFLLKDALIGVYDLQSFQDDEFCWSFATTDQAVILAALNIGETFDVKLKKPYKRILHISKYHFPPGVPNSGYGKYPIHVSVDEPRENGFRITTSYEPGSTKIMSRLPFFFGFRIYGFRNEDKRPIWRKFLSDAATYAQSKDWGTALIHVAFALESFIDTILMSIFEKSDFGESYQSHLLRVGEKREEFHALLHNRMNKTQINRLYEKVNGAIFKPRNNIAHGKENRESINSGQYITAIKTAVETIWDLDKRAREYLIPIMQPLHPSSLIDQQLIKNCGGNLF